MKNKTILAAHIAKLIPEFAKDSVINNEQIIYGLLDDFEKEIIKKTNSKNNEILGV